MKLKRHLILGRKAVTNQAACSKVETLFCQQRSIQSKLWFFLYSCTDVRVGLERQLSTKELMLLNYEYSGLISFRMDWLISLLSKVLSRVFSKHHSSEASILWCSAFFIVQLSHPYMTTGKTVALTRWTFVGKVMPLLFIYLLI